ncbi:MAG: biopolymer transport protein ExbD [Verrucomicrobiales bacterium]|jgi:biopolymer transport protein ExbD
MTARRPNRVSKKRPNLKAKSKTGALSVHDDNSGVDLSSLIDVSFLLLIFFIATSTLQPEESDIGLTLPAGKSQGVDIDLYAIELQADGAVIGNDEPLDTDTNQRELPRLLERLKVLRAIADATDTEPQVVFAAADEARGQRFLDVMNCLATVDISNVTLKFPSNF